MTKKETDRLALLIPECKIRVEQLVAAMGARGFDVFVGQTLRTHAQQQEAVARGTTSAHQTTSWHELGRAADLRKRLPDGSVDETTHDEAFFRAIGEEAHAVGLRSLAFREDGTKLLIHTSHGEVWDAGHVEFRFPFDTLAQAVYAARKNVG